MRRVAAFALFVTFGLMAPASLASAEGFLLPTWRPAEVPDATMAGSDVTLAVEPHATAAQVAAIGGAVRRTRGVMRYAHVERKFRIDTFQGVRAGDVRRRLAQLDGVDDAWLSAGHYSTDVVHRLEPCPDPGFELVVSMALDAADIQRDAVRAFLDADPRLWIVVENDPATTLAMVRRQFPGRYPDADVHHFATSFAVHTAPDVDNMFVQQLFSLGGVEAAVTSTDIGCEAIAARGMTGT